MSTWTDPAAAAEKLQASIDLVITDVSMPGLNGFELADVVVERLGNAPPRTLLISGEDHQSHISRIPPDRVIGLVDKPISLGHMHRIIRLIGQTRGACPGSIAPCCAVRNEALKRGDVENQPWSHFCRASTYARCPHYNAEAGKVLRQTVRNPFYTEPA